ncbi:MAG: hypothetical protein P8103_17000 [Candidatus Thiodiazotropha sp.]
MKTILVIPALLFGLILTGCGGGGGGGDSAQSLSVSQSSISFAANRGGPTPAPQTLTARVSDLSTTVYGGVFFTQNAIDSVTYDLSANPVPITIYPKAPVTLTPGTHTDEVTIVACKDQYCDTHISGSPYVVQVTYTVGDLSSSPSALAFTAQEGDVPAVQTLSLNNATSNSTWSASIAYQGTTTDWLTVSPASGSGSSNTVSVGVNALTAGTYDASIVFSAGALSLTVPVTYTVSSSIAASPSTLSFNVVEGSVPASKNIDISGLDTSWSASVRYANTSGWLSISPTSGTGMPATLSVSPSALTAGTYSAEVVITYNVGSMTGEVPIPVTYVVDPIRLDAPANTSFNIDLGSSASEAQQTVNISTNAVQNLNWTATSSASWLTISPGSGNTSSQNQLTLSLDLGELRTLASGTYNSTVTVSTTYPGVPDVDIAVQLILDTASIDFVTPYVLYANQPRQITIKGSGLMQAAGLSMEIGAATIPNFTVVDDTELNIEIPALPAGEYSFHLVDDLGIAPTSGRLLVKPAPEYQDVVVTIHGRPESIEYDPERDAFFAVLWDLDYGTDFVAQRIRFDGTQWAVVDLSVQKPLAVGLTVDGSELLVTTENCEVVHVDPDTLAIKSTSTYPGICYIERFEMVNSFDDGQILVADTNQWPTVWEYPSFTNFSVPSVHNPISIRTRNRNAMLWAESPTISAPRSIHYYSSKTDSFTQFAVQDSDTYFTSYNLAISDDGKRLIHTFDVYDENQSYIGSLDGLIYNGLDRVGITPDGSRAVRFSYDTKNLSIFDLSNDAGPFPQLGSDLALPSGTFDSAFKVELSHDGSAAFVFGDKAITQNAYEYKFSVTPLP